MKSSLGGIGFLSRCCNLFIILFILRFEKPSKQAKQFQIILEILRKVHVIRHGSHGTRSRSLDIGQVLFCSVYGPRRSRGTIFSPLDQTSLVNKGFTIIASASSSEKSLLRNTACNP